MLREHFLPLLNSWENTGKTQFLSYVKENLPTASESLADFDGDEQGALSALYRLLAAAVTGSIRKESAARMLSECSTLHPDMPGSLTDLFNLVDLELSTGDSASHKERLYWMVRATENTVSNAILRERMEVDTFSHIDAVKNQKVFNSKFIKLKTKLYYKQRKFNLFREESEGYSKLLVELCQWNCPSDPPHHMLETVKSIIGCFNLDPNRVLDVLLTVLRVLPERHSWLVPLLRLYMPSAEAVSGMVGAQYALSDQYGGEHSGSGGEGVGADLGSAARPLSALSLVTALLLRDNVFQLHHIWSRLSPDDSVISKHHERTLSAAFEFQKRTFVVSTKDKDEKDIPEDENIDHLSVSENSKLSLCQSCLLVGDWETASQILAMFPDGAVISNPPIAHTLCQLIHARIDPIYRRHRVVSKQFRGKQHVPHCLTRVSGDDSLAAFRHHVAPLLFALGPELSTDVALLHKVLCVANAAHHERVKQSEPDSDLAREQFLYYDTLSVLEEAVLPALTLLDTNCCLAEQVWTLLQHYPYQHRYRIYGTWKNEIHKRHPQLIRRRAEMIKLSKSLMKRISKENVKPIGRLMGKATHNAPGYMFEYMLGQIQIYDNLIGPMVDSLKYLTNLSYDVLAYCIIEALANPGKDRTKHDGTSLSLWLTSLANFCGVIFKKYSLDLTGLMQYVANQLKSMKSLDLLILREVVQKMTGVEITEEITEDQLSAMSGGELLRNEAGFLSQVRNTKRSTQRLKDNLIESRLVAPLVLLMAQQRNCVVFRETEGSHLKLVGKLYDQCQDTMVQFGQFLSSTLSTDDYRHRLPPLDQLLSQFHVGADVAFFLARPMIVSNIQQCYDELRKAEKNHKCMPSEQRCEKYVDACERVLAPVVGTVISAFPVRTWDDLSASLFTTFWTLTLHDLHVPGASYEKEIRRQKLQVAEIGESRELTESKRKKEQERCQMLADKLHEEEKRQKEHVERITARLNKEKEGWFDPRQVKSAKAETMTQLVQMCLFPRSIFTSTDALYCAAFVHTLHKLRTPNFSILICYDRLFCNMAYTFSSCTEHEASRYGRFLCALLGNVMHWHSSIDVFNVECSSYPSFFTKFRQSYKQNECSDHVDFKNYRHICFKWYCKITKALITCLDSGDYVQIRNALIVLIKILPIYPKLGHIASIIEKKVEVVIKAEKNKRQDLWLVATSYIGQLRSMKDSFVGEQDFHEKPPPPVSVDRSRSDPAAGSESTKRSSTSASSNSSKNTASSSVSNRSDAVHSMSNGTSTKTVEAHEVYEESQRTVSSSAIPEEVAVRMRSNMSPHSPLSEQSNHSRSEERSEKRHQKRSSSRRSDRDADEIHVVEDEYFERPRAVAPITDTGIPSSHSRGSNSAEESSPSDKSETKRRRTESKRTAKLVEKDDDKKKRSKKFDRVLEEGEIRSNRREEKKERKRGYLESRDSSLEMKRKREEEKIVKRRSADDIRSLEEKERRRSANKIETMEDYGEECYDGEPVDWVLPPSSSDRQRHHKDKHTRSSRVVESKRR